MKDKNYRLKISSPFIFILSVLVLFPSYSLLRANQGVRLKINTDGAQIKGKLLEVRENCLLLQKEESGQLMGHKVEFIKIKSISMKKKSNVGKGVIYGCLLGGTAGFLAGRFGGGCADCERPVHQFFGSAFGIGIGGLIGGGIAGFSGGYREIYNKEYSIGNLQQALYQLNKKALYHNPNLKLQL